MPSNIAPGTPLCAWKKSEMKCHAAGPPGDFLFTTMISCAIVIFALPFGVILAYLCEEVMYLNADWSAYSCFTYCQKDDPPTADVSDETTNELLTINLSDGKFVFANPEEEAVHILDKVMTMITDDESLGTSHDIDMTDKQSHIEQVKQLLGLDIKEPVNPTYNSAKSLPSGGVVINLDDQSADDEKTSFSISKKNKYLNEILKKLEGGQAGADDICEQMEALEKLGLNNDQLDMCLLRAFIAEMFFEDAGDAGDALAPDYLNLDMVDPFLWIFAWVVVLGIWFFCLYWALVWGIVNGEDILIIWLIEFGTAIVQDIFFFIPIVILLMNSSVIVRTESKMRHVYNVLEEIASRLILKTDSKQIQKADPNVVLAEEDALTVGFNAIQYTSSACRAARTVQGRNLPSAQLLAIVTDLDVSRVVKNPGGHIKYSFVLLLMLPIVWIFEGLILDMFIEVVVPVSWTGFMVANMYGLQKIFWLFIGFYVATGIFLIWYFHKNINDLLKFLRDCCATSQNANLAEKREEQEMVSELVSPHQFSGESGEVNRKYHVISGTVSFSVDALHDNDV